MNKEQIEQMARNFCVQKYREINIGNDDLWGASKVAFIAGFQKCQELMLDCDNIEPNEIDKRLAKSYMAGMETAKLSSFKEIEELKAKLAQAEARNKVYIEALCFYANGYAHEVDDSCNAYFRNSHIRQSSGKRAREALNSGKDQ
jgi:hypothetical protein